MTRVDANEVWLLSYYAASELAGGLLFGKMARWTTDPYVRAKLIWQCAEETRHAWEWIDTIQRLGAEVVPVPETYQSHYFARVGIPRSTMELVALTYLFEQRVAKHFAAHLRRANVHPLVQDTLRRLIQDERQHLGWIHEQLETWKMRDGAAEAAAVLQRFADIERSVYEAELHAIESRGGDLGSFAAELRLALALRVQ